MFDKIKFENIVTGLKGLEKLINRIPKDLDNCEPIKEDLNRIDVWG